MIWTQGALSSNNLGNQSSFYSKGLSLGVQFTRHPGRVYRDLGLRASGFRVEGFRSLGIRGLGSRV